MTQSPSGAFPTWTPPYGGHPDATRSAGGESHKDRTVQWIGDSSLDPFVDEAFQELKNKGAEHPWVLDNQCNQETFKLIIKAQEKQREVQREQAKKRQIPLTIRAPYQIRLVP